MEEDLFSVFEDESSPKKPLFHPPTRRVQKGKHRNILGGQKRGPPEPMESEEEDSSKKAKVNEEADIDALSLVESAPRIRIHTLEGLSGCTHEVAIPPGQEYETPYKTYPFTLDSFQSQAISCIENNQSVLVSAHTSAGKTVTAEYAIALSLKEKMRFYEEFSDVGLMTGDVTINPMASCLIMTTEILRSMLYRGSEIMREVGWVIFDEIHYMRDTERGVVWEETIILLPDNVHYVFLSATIPNARQFVEWIAHLHSQPCHVVYTDYRPTPLQHYIFPSGGDGIHLVVDEFGVFKEDNFNQAMSVLQNAIWDAGAGDKRGKRGGMKPQNNCYKIVKMIMERSFAPECEAYAMQMAKLDFNIDEVFQNAMMVLSEEDRSLPQVENASESITETVEILFGEGLIKALFATETFAMGLNMPARTVLFTGTQKFDGKDFRWIRSGEYIQIGLDDKGIVILMVDEKMAPSVGKNIVKGLPDPINSAFHLTYNMVLNLLRVEEINPEYMMERSFHQFQNYSNIPKLYEKTKALEEKLEAVKIVDEEEISSYYCLKEQLKSLSNEFHDWLVKPQYVVPFLQAGRLVSVKHGSKDFGFGAVVNFRKMSGDKKANPAEGGQNVVYIVDTLLHVTKETSKCKSTYDLEPLPHSEKGGEMIVVPIKLELIQKISSVRIFMPKDIRPIENRCAVLKSIQQVAKRMGSEIPLLDPVKEMMIGDKDFKELIRKISVFEKRLLSHPLSGNPRLESVLEEYGNKEELKKAKSLLQMSDLKCMKRVLRRLDYCSSADVIEMKGRIACELGT
ncbi:Superkiller viralicidic activity 2like 2like, partial [Caligus rogercresseyi]